MDKETARKVCELVAGILSTDGEVHPAEGKLLGRVVKTFGDPFGFGENVRPTVDANAAAGAIAELPGEIREEALNLLIEAAVVDGKVLPSEQRYLEAVARAMGTSQAALDEQIAKRLLDG